MLNPSTADGTQDDATIRKCIGFTRRWGYSSLEVVNLYAYRATSPRELKAAGYQIGGACADGVIVGACQRSRIAVLAWGNHAQAGRAEYIMRLVRRSMAGGDGSVFCLGVTQLGQPRHPLMVPYSQQLVRPPFDVSLHGESFPAAVPLAEVLP
jgi:hypothetical protein